MNRDEIEGLIAWFTVEAAAQVEEDNAFFAKKINAVLAALRAQQERIEQYRTDLERSGRCMSCIDGPPEPYGCSDCLNTGWDGGDPFVQIKTQRDRIDALEAVVREGRRAIGEHWAPNDCYATGPMTGDAIRDLVQCPACSFIALHDATLTGEKQS